jgi:hypothetical protein
MYSQKDRLHVLILARGLEVRGDLHVLAGSRLTDALNSKGKDFFPLTDATVSLVGAEEPLQRLEYIVVNRDSIDCIMEIDSL